MDELYKPTPINVKGNTKRNHRILTEERSIQVKLDTPPKLIIKKEIKKNEKYLNNDTRHLIEDGLGTFMTGINFDKI